MGLARLYCPKCHGCKFEVWNEENGLFLRCDTKGCNYQDYVNEAKLTESSS